MKKPNMMKYWFEVTGIRDGAEVTEVIEVEVDASTTLFPALAASNKATKQFTDSGGHLITWRNYR